MGNLIELLKIFGPQTGKELIEKTNTELFVLWKACNSTERVVTRTIGTRYLRLDRHIEGYARLSPSILREFCNYSVIALKEQSEAAVEKAERLHQEIKKISKDKMDLARNIMEKVISSQPDPEIIRGKACFIIAGDVACEMAHLEPRPEFSTGKMVNGSDLDIVIVYNGLPQGVVKNIDSRIYEKKFRYLNNPLYKEEIDYVIKDLEKTKKQLEFEDFESMVASKVLDEGRFLCGNYELFSEIKKMIKDNCIPEKLTVLEQKAAIDRENAKRQLLALSESTISDNDLVHLFYTTSEREEFF